MISSSIIATMMMMADIDVIVVGCKGRNDILILGGEEGEKKNDNNKLSE